MSTCSLQEFSELCVITSTFPLHLITLTPASQYPSRTHNCARLLTIATPILKAAHYQVIACQVHVFSHTKGSVSPDFSCWINRFAKSCFMWPWANIYVQFMSVVTYTQFVIKWTMNYKSSRLHDSITLTNYTPPFETLPPLQLLECV